MRLWISLAALTLLSVPQLSTHAADDAALDQRIASFLESRRGSWRDLNIPESDGRILHDLIVSRGLRHAVEIGTSTGHSGLWIARALAQTDGKLITIEIDARRHQAAQENFAAAGVAALVDSRLGDAHEIVPQLPGPIDFVFSDADKEGYKSYFVALWPKMSPGGCFTAHNVNSNMRGIREFLAHVRSLPDATTTIVGSRSGLSVTCKEEAGAAR